jgi:hypothetical protein
VLARDERGWRLQTPCGELLLPEDLIPAGTANVTLSVRPENVAVSETPRQAVNEWTGTIESQLFLGEYQDLRVRVGNALLHRACTPSSPLTPGAGCS